MATKVFEDEYITISPSGTNVVGNPHTFTATVFLNDGDGTGYNPDPGATVIMTLTDSNGATATPAGPFTLTTNASGQVSETFTSATAGVVTGSASTTLTISGGGSITRTTGDSDPLDGPVATKVFEDEYITISPSGTNVVGNPHTFTATVFLNDGDGTGYNPVGAGTSVIMTLTDSNGATATPAGPFTLTTNASGQVSETFTSATAGVVIGSASTTLTISGGGSITRTTGDSDPLDGPVATKVFEDEYITISPSGTNVVGNPHTFTATVFLNDGDGTGYNPVGAGTS